LAKSENLDSSELSPPANTTGACKTILYVDDNDDNQALVKRIIRDEVNYELISAEDGINGIRLAEEHLPDLILMDINLPGINGIEVFRRLRKIEATKDIPVWAVSANSFPPEIDSALEIGFDQYVVKPINIRSFMERIHKELD
jgi:ribose transport system substrate-binding protein